jgi:hypothetical protein
MTTLPDRRRVVTVARAQAVPLVLLAAGAVVAAVGLIKAPERTWPNLLIDGFYFLSLGVSGAFFVATQRLTSARWSAGLRRVPEALMLTLPVAAALMVVIYLGRHQLYPWADPAALAHEPAIAGKVTYLKPGFVTVRMIAVIAIWMVFAFRFRKASLAQDRSPDQALFYHARLNRHAAIFTPVFAITFSLAAYDWIISLEPEWFSTMFAVYVFAGTFVQGIAAVTLTTLLLRRRGLLGKEAGAEQLHDLGKMLFAFSTFWAYIWVCQYLLIWYGNIPEEATYYVARTSGAWLPLFLINLLVNWIIPFLALLSARAKRTPRILMSISILFLVGHWLDMYILVAPSKWTAPHFGVPEVLVAAGFAALIYLATARSLARAPMVPMNDPVLLADRLPAEPVAAHAHAQGKLQGGDR